MAVQQALQQAAAAEKKIDAEIAAMNNLGGRALEQLRVKRIQELKEQQRKRAEWIQKGHGKYQEVFDEKAWFQEVKNNERCVIHFYRGTTNYCQLVDAHLEKIAAKHIETRFSKIDAEKCPFLVERLLIVVMPTIIMTKDGSTNDRLEGFTELGNTDRFTTFQLEERLAMKGTIEMPRKQNRAQEAKTYNSQNKSGAAIYSSRRQATMVIDDADFDDLSD
jgi:thioredoxin-like negative regulator of GroEL